MNGKIKEHILGTAKACLPNEASKKGLVDGLDLTIFSFVTAIPPHLLTNKILEEVYLRLAKQHTALQKAGIELDQSYLEGILGKTPENPVERTRLVSDKLKSNNNFNSEAKRVSAIAIENDEICFYISKELSSNTFISLLKRYGEPIALHGSCKAFKIEISNYNLVDFLIPEVELKYIILGVEDYKSIMQSRYMTINARPMTEIVTTHQASRNIIIGVNDTHFDVLCGAEMLKKAAKFLRALDSQSENNIFKLRLQYANVVKTLIDVFPENVYTTRALDESLPLLLKTMAEPPYTTIKRKSVPMPRFAVMRMKLTGVYFEINHFPRDPEIVMAMKKTFPNGKFGDNRNYHTVKTFKEYMHMRRLLLDWELPLFSEYGNGNDALYAAASYIKRIENNPKATIKHLGGRGFEIIRFESAKPIERDFVTKEETDELVKFIGKNKPTCDTATANALIKIDELGCHRVSTKNGRLFEVRAERGSIRSQFSFLPAHCIRWAEKSVIVTILTATHGMALRELLLSYGFAAKKDINIFLPLLNKQIDAFQQRYDKSYTNTGSIQIPTFGGNDQLEPSQRGCIEYGYDDPRFMIGDEPGFGKTWEAFAYVELKQAYPVLIVVPKIGKLSWSYEFLNLIKGRKHIVLGSKPINERQLERDAIKNSDVVIVNYDMLDEFSSELSDVKWNSMLVDESHYIKNEDTIRTQTTHTIKDKTNPSVVIELSGSFWENRPIELVPQLKLIGKLGLFGGRDGFIKRYCTSPGKASGMGASNLDELNEVLRTHCMIRRQKSQGGKSKWRQAYVPVNDLNLTEYRKVEASLAKYVFEQVAEEVKGIIEGDPSLKETEAELTAQLIKKKWFNSAAKAQKLVEISKLRQLIGQAKVDSAKEFIDSILSGEEKLVVFAHHRDVQEALYKHYSDSNIKTVQIVSSMNDIQRKNAELEFLEGEARLIICSIGAASETMNFASASHVVFVEGREKPMTQARKRIDRKPQKSDILNGWYLRAIGTVDDWLYDLSDSKLEDFSKGSGDKVIDKIQRIETEDFATILVDRYFKKAPHAA